MRKREVIELRFRVNILLKSQMREICTSGSVRGCKTEPLTQTKHWVKVR